MTKKKKAHVDPDKGYEVPVLEYLDEPDQKRYLHLRGKASLTKAELKERRDLRAKSHKWQEIMFVWKYGSAIRRAREERRARPQDPSVARNFLRAMVGPCYPLFDVVWLQQCVSGAHNPQTYPTPARQGLESVLYAMEHTRMVDTLADPERRVYFLTSLDMMLEPFRMLKRDPDPELGVVEHSRLEQMFELSASGSGSSTKDQKDATSEEWGMPCFDVHLLLMAGIKITPAIARVAKADGVGISSLTLRYSEWFRHTVRSKCNEQGDSYAREAIEAFQLHALIDIGFPPLSATPPAHPRK